MFARNQASTGYYPRALHQERTPTALSMSLSRWGGHEKVPELVVQGFHKEPVGRWDGAQAQMIPYRENSTSEMAFGRPWCQDLRSLVTCSFRSAPGPRQSSSPLKWPCR